MAYFAFGSNMHPARMRDRVSSAVPLGLARLPGHALRFHKRGADGSGKCDVGATGREEDVVFGVLYEMVRSELPLLDAAESRGRGYDRREETVLCEGRPRKASLYVAERAYVDASLRPYSWYLALVVEGARRNRLPEDYVARLERVACVPDPDPERERRHRAFLGRSQAGTPSRGASDRP